MNLLRSYMTPAGKQALANLIGLGVCTAITQGCSFGLLLILTNTLSPTEFGAIIFALNLQTYLVTLGTFGLATIVVRDLAQQPDRADETTSAFLCIIGVSSVLTGVLAAVVVAFAPLSWDERLLLWCLAAWNVFACFNLSPLFDAEHRQALSAALMLPGDILTLGVVYGLSVAGTLSVFSFGLVFLGKWMTTSALHFAVFGQRVRPLRLQWDWIRIKRMMKAGRPLMAAALLSMVPMSGSVVLIRILSGEEMAAIYGLAFQIVGIELLVITVLVRIVQPHINGQHGLATRFVWQLSQVFGCATLTLMLCSIAIGWVLFFHILKPVYHGAFEILVIMQAFVLMTTLAWLVNYYLLRFHYETWIRLEYLTSAIAFALLVLLSSTQFEICFAASACTSSAVLLLFGVWGLRRRLRVPPFLPDLK